MKPPRTLLLTRREAAAGLAALASQALLPARAQTGGEAPAGVSLYAVELVIFRGGGAAAGEDLGATARSRSDDSDSAAADAAKSVRFAEVLPSSRYHLGDVVGRLNASGSHKVIAHVAWTQTASAWNSGSGVSAEQLGLGAYGIAGQVQLERGTYLHLGLNLTYSPAGGGHYALSEMRRVRFAERNYFDHPAVGVIALVSPGGESR